MRLYFIKAVMGDNAENSLDLFVKADSPTEAIGYWRLYYDLSKTDTWYDSIHELPCVVEGEAGAVAWDSLPAIDKQTIGTARVDAESFTRVVLDLTVEEFERIKIALNWYIDDREECARAEEGFGICEASPEEHRAAGDEAQALLEKLRRVGNE